MVNISLIRSTRSKSRKVRNGMASALQSQHNPYTTYMIKSKVKSTWYMHSSLWEDSNHLKDVAAKTYLCTSLAHSNTILFGDFIYKRKVKSHIHEKNLKIPYNRAQSIFPWKLCFKWIHLNSMKTEAIELIMILTINFRSSKFNGHTLWYYIMISSNNE